MTTCISVWKHQRTGRTRCPHHQDRRPMMNEDNPSEGRHLSIIVYGVTLRKTTIFRTIVVKNSTFARQWLVGKHFWYFIDLKFHEIWGTSRIFVRQHGRLLAFGISLNFCKYFLFVPTDRLNSHSVKVIIIELWQCTCFSTNSALYCLDKNIKYTTQFFFARVVRREIEHWNKLCLLLHKSSTGVSHSYFLVSDIILQPSTYKIAKIQMSNLISRNSTYLLYTYVCI